MQLFSAAIYSLSHGMNDAQKTIGIITWSFSAVVIWDRLSHPAWVMLACYTVIALGTLSGDGASSRRWGPRSPSSSRWAASARKRRQPFPSWGIAGRYPRQHDPYDNRRNHGGRIDQKVDRCSMGNCRDDCLGLDPDHPDLWHTVGRDLFLHNKGISLKRSAGIACRLGDRFLNPGLNLLFYGSDLGQFLLVGSIAVTDFQACSTAYIP